LFKCASRPLFNKKKKKKKRYSHGGLRPRIKLKPAHKNKKFSHS